MLCASIHKKVFEFAFDARTSRGPMREKTSWFLKLWDDATPAVYGLGECGPLPLLSPEHTPALEEQLIAWATDLQNSRRTLPREGWQSLAEMRNFFGPHELSAAYASVGFALETALLDLHNGGTRTLFKNTFLAETPVPINGLVWMGGLDFMLQQVELKIRDGYRCIKLKVGGLDFEKECDVLQYIRRKYFREDIEIRLDANGAFKKEEALQKINNLKRFNVHSIEQPIKPGQAEMAQLCRESPIPIALDEELIGIQGKQQKEELLRRLQPQYIILKPTLHGGLLGCEEWIKLAEALNIGWWLTSALESNIGLNAIAQFAANYPVRIPHGLGTGQIYTNNFPSPLLAETGVLRHQASEPWDLTGLFPDEAKESLYLAD